MGVSVVNALSDRLHVEVALNQTLYTQTYERGAPKTKLVNEGKVHNRRGTKITFTRTRKSSARARISFPSASTDGALKAYLFGGVEIRWNCAAGLIGEKDVQ